MGAGPGRALIDKCIDGCKWRQNRARFGDRGINHRWFCDNPAIAFAAADRQLHDSFDRG